MIKNIYITAQLCLASLLSVSCATSSLPSETNGANLSSDLGFQKGEVICRTDIINQSIKNNSNRRVLVAAHRGAHGDAPENSIPSISHAVKVGADIIELDVRLTRDKVPVLLHDADLSRTTNGTGMISDLTWNEIQDLYLVRGDGSHSLERIPLLSDALTEASDSIIVNLDLKVSDITEIVDVVKNSQYKSSVMFYRSDLETLSKVRELSPNAVVMPLAKSKDQAKFFASNFDLEIVHLQEKYASRSLANYLDKKRTSNWLNSLGKMDKLLIRGSRTAVDGLISSGVDIIQTDYPELLVDILDERKLRINYMGTTPEKPCYVSL